MPSSRCCTLVAAILALATSGSLYGQASDRPLTGDDVLRTHSYGIHAAPVSETGMTETPQPDTVAVAAAPSRDSLDAANRARADSAERTRLAALDAENRARADSLARASAALREELTGPIHFEFDRSGIQPADRAGLDRKAAILTANPGVRVRIAGYCDERGSDEYNLALGNRRAAAAKQYLVERGIDAGRLDAVSVGSASPIDTDHTEAAWALNRRAGFEVASGEDALTAPVALR
jgi:peptidoglycan-associated lipoprotein